MRAGIILCYSLVMWLELQVLTPALLELAARMADKHHVIQQVLDEWGR